MSASSGFYAGLPVLGDFSDLTPPPRSPRCSTRRAAPRCDRAHMTCLVFSYSGKHLHFIDGADGGLFSAAKAFKERAAKL